MSFVKHSRTRPKDFALITRHGTTAPEPPPRNSSKLRQKSKVVLRMQKIEKENGRN